MNMARSVLLKNPFSIAGLVILLIMAAATTAVPWLTTLDPVSHDVSNRLLAPTASHPFGTDSFGRDVFTRVLYGGRASMMVGLVTTLFSSTAGIFIGLITGYRLGTTDSIVMRLIEALMSIPGVLLAIGIVAVLGSGTGNIILALSVIYTPRMARVIRGSVISTREREYVEAAKAIGGSEPRLLFRHLLPNCLSPAIIQATITFAYAVLAEASLSFLGLGVPPPAPSWGDMLREGKQFLHMAPWIALFPGIAISLTVFGINLVGDALRDILDPRS